MIDKIKLNHEILGNIDIDLNNNITNKPYKIIAFVGENSCGKTTLLSSLETKERALFIRQNALYNNIKLKASELIGGNYKYYKCSNCDEDSNNFSINKQIMIDSINEFIDDDNICKIIDNEILPNLLFDDELTSLIDGKKSPIDMNLFSSGEKELIVKLYIISKYNDIDIVLLDEPETSLHPRWQKAIIKIIYSIISKGKNKNPQMFVATHSEKVLESIIEEDDSLIISFSKTGDKFNIVPMYNYEHYLPTITFAELDYSIFGIASTEYHDQLFNEYSSLIGVDNIGKVDRAIISNKNYTSEYKKQWRTITKKNYGYKENNYETLPVYIRNYFHHPKEGLKPTNSEIEKSIQFLIVLIKEQK